MESLGQHTVTSLAQRQGEDRTADHATVHEGHLEGTVAPPLAGPGDPPMNAHPLILKRREGNQLLDE